MIRMIAMRALLGAALAVTTFPMTTTAQAEGPTPDGTEWHLTAYDDGGLELTEVPWDLVATLTLGDRAFGSTGCNGFSATYELDGKVIAFGEPGHTDVGCPDATMEIEAAYMAALPKVARWAIDTGASSERDLILFDADDEHLLRFSSSDTGLLFRQIRELTAQVDAQQAEIDRLRARIRDLERQAS